jgi:hypothetical protein
MTSGEVSKWHSFAFIVSLLLLIDLLIQNAFINSCLYTDNINLKVFPAVFFIDFLYAYRERTRTKNTGNNTTTI